MADRGQHELLERLGQMIERVARSSGSQAAFTRITVSRGENTETLTLTTFDEVLELTDSINDLIEGKQ